MLAAWKDPIPRRVLKYELLLSALRNKLLLKKYSFKLDENIDSTQAIRDLVVDLRLAKNDFNVCLELSSITRSCFQHNDLDTFFFNHAPISALIYFVCPTYLNFGICTESRTRRSNYVIEVYSHPAPTLNSSLEVMDT